MKKHSSDSIIWVKIECEGIYDYLPATIDNKGNLVLIIYRYEEKLTEFRDESKEPN